MSWDFDSIPKYVINLDRRRDRWQTFKSASGIESVSNLQRWPATDGKNINLDEDTRVSLFTKHNVIREVRRSHMELNSKGGVGCYISHVDVWKHFLEKSTSDVGIVFEDDTILDTNAILRIKKFINSSPVLQNYEMWDFCILSPYYGNKKHEPLYIGDDNCIRLMEFNGLTGYLINKKGVRKILPLVYPIQGHIDWFLSICAQLQYIDLCCPRISLLKVRGSPTDIQKTNKCEICDIKTDFDKDSTIIPKWRLNSYMAEELIIVCFAAYFIYKNIKK